MKNENLLWIVIGIVAVLFLFSGVSIVGYGSRGYGYGGMMNMMYGGYGSNMMFFGWLYGLLVLVALVFLIIWLYQQISKQGDNPLCQTPTEKTQKVI